jgi:hypothetical protein
MPSVCLCAEVKRRSGWSLESEVYSTVSWDWGGRDREWNGNSAGNTRRRLNWEASQCLSPWENDWQSLSSGKACTHGPPLSLGSLGFD